MNNCCSLTLRVGRIRLDSESQATSMGQLFMRQSLGCNLPAEADSAT